MIVSFLLDPGLFESGSLGSSLAYAMKDLLQGILSNGVLLDTQSAMLFKKSLGALSLDDPHLYSVRQLLEEIWKDKRRCIANVAPEVGGGCSTDLRAILLAIAGDWLPDCVVATDAVHRELRKEFEEGDRPLVTALPQYSRSDAEAMRRYWEKLPDALDTLPDERRESLLDHMVSYARRLGIFDPQIGVAGNHMYAFLEGIAEIVRMWDKSIERFSRGNWSGPHDLDIYTCAGYGGKGFVSRDKSVQEMTERLRDPLERQFSQFGLRVTIQVKDDENKDFHARVLAANGRVFQFERGFDFFRGRGPHPPGLPPPKRRWRCVLVSQPPWGPGYVSRLKRLPSM